jgi:hypothetical protein
MVILIDDLFKLTLKYCSKFMLNKSLEYLEVSPQAIIFGVRVLGGQPTGDICLVISSRNSAVIA